MMFQLERCLAQLVRGFPLLGFQLKRIHLLPAGLIIGCISRMKDGLLISQMEDSYRLPLDSIRLKLSESLYQVTWQLILMSGTESMWITLAGLVGLKMAPSLAAPAMERMSRLFKFN